MQEFLNQDFVHTHVHGTMSKFDGLAKISNLVMKARQMGFPALALTDHGTVGGWVKFIAECGRKKDKQGKSIPYPTIKPIIGIEAYVSRDHTWHGITDAKKNGYTGPNLQPEGRKGNRHLVLLAQNWQGYQNICRLSETSWTKGVYGDTPRIDIELMAKHSKGVMVQTACLSSIVNALLLQDKYEEAKQVVGMFVDIYGKDNVAIEVQYHGFPEQLAIIPLQLKLADDLDLLCFVANDVHCIEKSQSDSQEVLMCMSMKKCIHDKKRYAHPYPEFYLKSAEEMAMIFRHRPELLWNTVAWAERINSKEIESNMGGMRLPSYKVPHEFKTPQEYLEHLSWEGMKRIGWDRSPQHIDMLKFELNDVQSAFDNNDLDFATYFLIVWDYMNFAQKQGILKGPGRGSGYASVLLRTLNITYGPDPLKYGLLWGRFLGFEDKRFIKEGDFGLKDESIDLAEMSDLVEDRIDEIKEETQMDDMEMEEEAEEVAT